MPKDNFLEDVFGNQEFINRGKDVTSDIDVVKNFNRIDMNSILNMRAEFFEALSESVASIKSQIQFEVSTGQTGLDPERLELRNALQRLKRINIAIVGHPASGSVRRYIEVLIDEIADIEDELRTKPRGRI